MLFAVSCLDKPGALQVRLDNRQAHLDYLAGHAASVRLAGPYLSDEGTPAGSLLILEAADRAALDALLAEDPYARASLFQSVEVRPFRRTVGVDL